MFLGIRPCVWASCHGFPEVVPARRTEWGTILPPENFTPVEATSMFLDGCIFTVKDRHSFSNPSVALPTSQLILQPFRCFTYVTAYSPTLISLLLRHRLFTYVTWRAAQNRTPKLYHYILICILICAANVMKPFHRWSIGAEIHDRLCKNKNRRITNK